jgi:protein associated with RNAse G/E
LTSQKFTEYKTTYLGKTNVFECTLAERSAGEVVIVYEIPRPMIFAGMTFPLGSRSFGYFWEQRNYNVYHWKDPNQKTIGSYFNIAKDTRILEDKVLWNDLVVDVVVYPDGSEPLVLDEDEVPKSIDPSDREIIDSTKQLILSQAGDLTQELKTRTEKILSMENRE